VDPQCDGLTPLQGLPSSGANANRFAVMSMTRGPSACRPVAVLDLASVRKSTCNPPSRPPKPHSFFSLGHTLLS
jgi:hypothetical protein